MEGAEPAEIVTRLIDVLEQAVATLSGMGDGTSATGSPSASLSASQSAAREAPPPHRFDFVHNPDLRPVVEQAYLDSRRALEQENYDLALRTSCGILEAIVTDALAHKGLGALAAAGAPEGNVADWSFNTRLAVAERTGLIRNGCARLPAVARTYRDHTDADGESGAKATDFRARCATGQASTSRRNERSGSRPIEVVERRASRPSSITVAGRTPGSPSLNLPDLAGTLVVLDRHCHRLRRRADLQYALVASDSEA